MAPAYQFIEGPEGSRKARKRMLFTTNRFCLERDWLQAITGNQEERSWLHELIDTLWYDQDVICFCKAILENKRIS